MHSVERRTGTTVEHTINIPPCMATIKNPIKMLTIRCVSQINCQDTVCIVLWKFIPEVEKILINLAHDGVVRYEWNLLKQLIKYKIMEVNCFCKLCAVL